MHSVVINKKYYGAAIKDFVVVSDDIQYEPQILHDRARLGGKDEEVKIEKYFNDSYSIFVKRLNEFRDSKHILNASEEKELRFMFEALINAKKFLHAGRRVS